MIRINFRTNSQVTSFSQPSPKSQS